MTINPVAVLWWCIFGLGGYLIGGDLTSALWAVFCAMIISLIVSLR